MITISSSFKRYALRSAAALVTAASLASMAVPAQADGFRHGWQSQHTQSWSGQGGWSGNHYGGGYGNHYRPQVCYNDHQLYREIARYGYFDIRLGRTWRNTTEIRAVKDGWYWSARIDRCSGAVYDLHRTHRVPNRSKGNGFSFQFRF